MSCASKMWIAVKAPGRNHKEGDPLKESGEKYRNGLKIYLPSVDGKEKYSKTSVWE